MRHPIAVAAPRSRACRPFRTRFWILRPAPGSAIGNALGVLAAGAAYRGAHKYEFKGDLRDVTLRLNSEDAVEIQRGMSFVPLVFSESNYWGTYYGKDLARAGVLVLAPEMFDPVDDKWPTVALRIDDLKRPGRPLLVTLPQRTIERVWADFAPYREQRAADRAHLVVQP